MKDKAGAQSGVRDCAGLASAILCPLLQGLCPSEQPFPGGWPMPLAQGKCTSLLCPRLPPGPYLALEDGVGRLLLEGEWEAQEQVFIFPIRMGMAGRRRQPSLPNTSFLILNMECFKRNIVLSIRSYTKIYKHLVKYYIHIHFTSPWCKYNVSLPVTDVPPSFVFYFFFSLCPQVPSPARELSNAQKILTEWQWAYELWKRQPLSGVLLTCLASPAHLPGERSLRREHLER